MKQEEVNEIDCTDLYDNDMPKTDIMFLDRLPTEEEMIDMDKTYFIVSILSDLSGFDEFIKLWEGTSEENYWYAFKLSSTGTYDGAKEEITKYFNPDPWYAPAGFTKGKGIDAVPFDPEEDTVNL